MSRLAVVVFGSLFLAGPSLAAQASTAGTACSYDECSLRLEQGLILRGRQAERIGRFGLLGATRLSPLVGASDSARAYAAEFDRNYTAGARWSAVGGVGLGIVGAFLVDASNGSARPHDRWERRHWVLLGGAVVSVAVSEYGGRRLHRARRALSRAVWWHNRELVTGR